jgi:hypothetical protein
MIIVLCSLSVLGAVLDTRSETIVASETLGFFDGSVTINERQVVAKSLDTFRFIVKIASNMFVWFFIIGLFLIGYQTYREYNESIKRKDS